MFLLVAVNAKYIHSNPAVYSLRAYAGPDFDVKISEYTINNNTSDILRDIVLQAPDVIGFSCYIWNISKIKILISDIAKLLPSTDIWLGGPEVSFCAEEYLSCYPNVKGVFIGEGEASFKEVLKEYDSEKDFVSIPGICTRYNIGNTKMPQQISSDNIPFIYENGFSDFTNRIIYYESSRGCPFRCSYCLSSIDKTTTFRSLDLVKSELSFFLAHKVPQVKFIDRTFNCDKARALSIWKYIADNDNGITNFHFEIAADLLDDDSIKLLSSLRPGLVQLEIGVQSTNTKTLEAVNRPCDIAHISSIVTKLNASGNALLHLDLIAGLPYEDLSSFRKSFNDVWAMNPTVLQLGFLKVLKGSPIAQQVSDFNIKHTVEPPYEVLSTTWLSYSDICVLKDIEAVLEIYGNSLQYTSALPKLMTYFDTPFDFFNKLAEYYRNKNLFALPPARSARYEILYNFAVSACEIGSDTLKELLTLDFCLREKPKKLPDFFTRLPDGITIDYSSKNPVTGNYRIN